MGIQDLGQGCYKILFWVMIVVMLGAALVAFKFMLDVQPYFFGP
jgi:hypothetical protein